MLHVLRHYLPLRKALLISSETVLISTVLFVGMSSHLWTVDETTLRRLANASLDPSQAFWRCAISAVLAAVLAQITISFNELYDFRISGSRYDRAARFLGSAGSGVLLVTLAVSASHFAGAGTLFLGFPGLPFTQTVVLLATSLGVAFVLLYLWRNVFHVLMHHSNFNQRLLVLGSGRIAHRTAEEIGGRGHAGYEIVANLSPLPDRRDAGGSNGGSGERRAGDAAERRRGGSRNTGNPWFDVATGSSGARVSAVRDADAKPAQPRLVLHPLAGQLEGSTALRTEALSAPSSEDVEVSESLFDLATRLRVTDIVVAFEDRRGQSLTDDLLRCRMEGIVVHEAEAFFEKLTGKIPAEAMRPSYLIFNRGFQQHPMAALAKRVFDIVFGIVVFALTWPLMVMAAIAVRSDSPGPILFKQERTGQGGRSFTLCKFRSMRADAEKNTGPVWAETNDPRITRVGAFLRKTRIDELPQLFNVLAGSMSFVGPRPERPNFVEELSEKIPYYGQRHIVKPGLTGWAQINYPYGNTVEDALQKLQYDLFYIKYQSLIFDLSIVMNTVKTVVLRKGT